MSITEILKEFGTDTAVIEGCTGVVVSYDTLHNMVRLYAEIISSISKKTLVFLYPVTGSIESIAVYLACLELGYPVCLIEPREKFLQTLVATYSPGLILAPHEVVTGLASLLPMSNVKMYDSCFSSSFSALLLLDGVTKDELHTDLRLLLLTSGSTGSPKLVRLQWKNIISNSTAIASYLGIRGGERCIQSLPMHYSYGLSLINSHLFNGGTVVLTKHSFMRPEFWKVVQGFGCTSFAGVPYMYETLRRLRFDPISQPTITTFTQAGGGLGRELTEHFYRSTEASGKSFVVMYGQTEATARMSYVPPDMLGQKIGSIGVAIPGGALSIEISDDLAELVYRGPNVMMGYSENRSSLALGDDLEGVLWTGDIGSVDQDGYFSVIGRKKRITKLFGQRIDLQDVEREAERITNLSVAALDSDGAIRLFVANGTKGEHSLSERDVQKQIAHFLQVPPNVIKVESIDMIPITSAGKRDYQALTKEIS